MTEATETKENFPREVASSKEDRRTESQGLKTLRRIVLPGEEAIEEPGPTDAPVLLNVTRAGPLFVSPSLSVSTNKVPNEKVP